jgi:hypothetical protein
LPNAILTKNNAPGTNLIYPETTDKPVPLSRNDTVANLFSLLKRNVAINISLEPFRAFIAGLCSSQIIATFRAGTGLNPFCQRPRAF